MDGQEDINRWRRQIEIESATVQSLLATQWTNPVDILSILMIIGGDVVQRALAQGSGKLYVPVCFSFGCVAYAFMGLVNIIGDGHLLPAPDYGCKVFNLASGYSRENKSFVIGRLLRDLEAIEARKVEESERDYAIKITVFRALHNFNGPSKFSWSRLHLIGLCVTVIQIGVSVIPYILNGDWSVLLIVLGGTFLVQWTGILPQWTAEKLPHRQDSSSVYALTSGNGSREVMVILGYNNCLDLESFAVSQTPRNSRPWEKFKWLSRRSGMQKPIHNPVTIGMASPLHRQETWRNQAVSCNFWPFGGFPLGFVITQVSYGLLSVLWLLLLINVSAAKSFPDSWCLLAIGGIGMFQNAWLASKEMTPESRNLPLRTIDTIKARKVMDGIMDFHYTYGFGEPLRNEFFPGKLRKDEEKWWDGNCLSYDQARTEVLGRGTPRRMLPEGSKGRRKYNYPASTNQLLQKKPTTHRNNEAIETDKSS